MQHIGLLEFSCIHGRARDERACIHAPLFLSNHTRTRYLTCLLMCGVGNVANAGLIVFVIHDNGGAGTPTVQLGEEAPPSFLMLSSIGCRVIIHPWVGRATRTNLRGVTSNRFFPLMTSLMTNAPFSRRPAM